MRVVWGLTGTSALPPAVSDVEIVTCEGAGQADESCSSNTCSVNALTGMTEMEVPACRPRGGTDSYGADPVLVRRGLPTGVPLRFELRGKNESGQVLFVGQAGPFVLGEGERRFVELRMYPIGSPGAVPGVNIERFLHTSTLLPDGRILIAGGFTKATRLAECPADSSLSEQTRCFELVATDEALAFDPGTGKVEPIRNAMLAARAGHTATLLPDGRVLLAGGAERALLAMTPQGESARGGYRMHIEPLGSGDSGSSAHASFELFDAYLDPEPEDGARDGDLGRGRFLGTAGQNGLGSLNEPRFMHAAAVVPNAPHRVLLAGGMGGASSPFTFEVFDNRRAGGFGVYTATDNRLPTPREMPGAFAAGGRIWIVGGTWASDNSELADVWTPSSDDPNGTIARASAESEFPNSIPGADEEHPEYALLRPMTASLGEDHGVAVGWYGPRCLPDTTAPIFTTDPEGTDYCRPPGGGSRAFTIAGTTGVTAPTTAAARSFGATAELRCFRPEDTREYVAFTGGISSDIWTPQPSVDVFDGQIDNSGAATRISQASLVSPRLFHTSTGVPGLGMVTVGGITFTVGLEHINFSGTVEVLFLPRGDYDGC